MNEQKVITLYDLAKWVQDWMHTCGINHANPKDVPFYIENNNRRYRPFSGNLGVGNKGVSVAVKYFDSDIVHFYPKDKRPAGGGEYWKSRGASQYDVSGFVESKPAGEKSDDVMNNKAWDLGRQFSPKLSVVVAQNKTRGRWIGSLSIRDFYYETDAYKTKDGALSELLGCVCSIKEQAEECANEINDKLYGRKDT